MASEKEVSLSIRTVNVKEIRFIDMAEGDNKDKKEMIKKTLKLGSDLTDEEIENLSAKDGIKITNAINDLNGFTTTNFQ